ncbi:MAG: hypothetical protein ACOC16_03440 [Nanoarchaeota archaeon]
MNPQFNTQSNQETLTINSQTLSKKTGKIFVMASDDYILNEQIKQLPNIKLINPKSSLGKLLAYDNTILKAEEFKPQLQDSHKILNSNSNMNYILLRQYFKQKKHPNQKNNTTTTQKTKQSSKTIYNTLPPINTTPNTYPKCLYQKPKFNINNSWYSQISNQNLESKIYSISQNNIPQHNSYHRELSYYLTRK